MTVGEELRIEAKTNLKMNSFAVFESSLFST